MGGLTTMVGVTVGRCSTTLGRAKENPNGAVTGGAGATLGVVFVTLVNRFSVVTGRFRRRKVFAVVVAAIDLKELSEGGRRENNG